VARPVLSRLPAITRTLASWQTLNVAPTDGYAEVQRKLLPTNVVRCLEVERQLPTHGNVGGHGTGARGGRARHLHWGRTHPRRPPGVAGLVAGVTVWWHDVRDAGGRATRAEPTHLYQATSWHAARASSVAWACMPGSAARSYLHPSPSSFAMSLLIQGRCRRLSLVSACFRETVVVSSWAIEAFSKCY